MSGTINISRDLWDDTAFAADPFSEREAWIWLIAEASWKPRPRRVGDYVVNLDRGQAAHSTRFLAETWGWSHSKVRRYLERLEKLNLIQRQTDTGVSVITVCKYDKFQNPAQAPGTGPAQVRHTSGTNEKKGEIRGKERETPPNGDTEDLQASVDAYNEAASRSGWASVQKLTPARMSALRARMREVGGLDGWREAIAKAEASDFLCGRVNTRDGPFMASFDFLTKPKIFTRLMEGNYDNRSGAISQPASGRQNWVDPAIANIARIAGLGEASGNDWGGTGSTGAEIRPFRMGS